ncbi:MAG: hypothetical protein JO147_01785, partial [Actinobacteria bacterium]|nr:hypothetical protein [Actinomycetota bacterium]
GANGLVSKSGYRDGFLLGAGLSFAGALLMYLGPAYARNREPGTFTDGPELVVVETSPVGLIGPSVYEERP